MTVCKKNSKEILQKCKYNSMKKKYVQKGWQAVKIYPSTNQSLNKRIYSTKWLLFSWTINVKTTEPIAVCMFWHENLPDIHLIDRLYKVVI